MTETIAPITPTTTPVAIDLQQVNQVANQANAVTGVYGISGSGKSNLVDTAIEYTWETFKMLSLIYAADLGGFGNKRLALIRAGIARVYDPRNHVDPFATMELISLGAWPETMIDPERGFADPHVKLILPRRIVSVLYCPQGHEVARDENDARLGAVLHTCPTCNTLTNFTNASKVDKVIVRSGLFKGVGFRSYDSLTSLNEWGMADLQDQSAKGTLPASGERGGSLLGAADALRSGEFTFGSSSVGQYGFLQNRTYGWLSNIRKIPDQRVPAVATFHVEQSKGDETTGGEMLYGPKIAGNARTGAMGGWLGNLVHATKEPFSAGDPTLVYRLWLTNHIDPRDTRKIPYIAKHRGTPLGMTDYLEDKPGSEPWSGFSLKVLFTKLQEQLDHLDADARKKYPDAPAYAMGGTTAAATADVEDEVIGNAAAPVADAIAVPVTGGRTIGRRRRPTATPAPVAIGVAAPGAAADPAASNVGPSVVEATPVVPAAGETSAPPVEAAGDALVRAAMAPSPILEQLEASLVERTAQTGNGVGSALSSVPSTPAAPSGQLGAAPPPPPPTPTTPPAPAAGVSGPRLRRVPRPPTT